MSEAAWAGVLLVLAALGFLDALYFTLVAYRWMRADPRWLPAFCRMDEATCARVVDTRWGRIGGLPNSVYGMVWYAAAGAAGGVGLVTGEIPACDPLLVAAAGAVAASVVLAWALVARLRTRCVLCFAAHAINVALLVVLAVGCKS